MAEDDDSKTEEPTQKKLDDAQKKGQSYSSREINSFLLLFTFTLLVGSLLPSFARDAMHGLSRFITEPDLMATDNRALGTELLGALASVTLPFFQLGVALMVAALAAGFLQKPLSISWAPMAPKFEKINPVKGFKKLASTRSLVEFGKGILKIILVGVIATWAIWPNMPQLKRLPTTSIVDEVLFLHANAIKLLIAVTITMFFLALGDYLYQRFAFLKSLRMTKQEIKEEYKQQEGDPHIKGRLKQIRMEKARSRMMAEVPTSDVVITNPTHYAVALRYDNATMAAPVIVAKGQDKVALRIREVAREHDITIVENPPLARALFPVELDQPVPVEHFQAVAEVISYVYKLKGRTLRPR